MFKPNPVYGTTV
jgi:hypothetical protein